ncbi:dual specificity phosphatase 29-like [Triplophysa dalaica]|uniref:dual specificity phosphatase 29-like n=1 Tax=Triplophysa dalaica TaxID=1582913 RepID=UPI0024DFF857|nr:dual specificity phosphatase 29-like [Triplophysa dalaica]
MACTNSRKEYMSVKDLQKVLDSCKLGLHQIDEVWPNIYISNVGIAQNRSTLQKLGITHILNAAHSKRGSIGDKKYYGTSVVYCGIPADDSTHFDLDVYFKPAADFIHKALHAPDGKVLVHCIMGMSRSSTLVLAYLMLYHNMSLHKAIKRVIQKRAIYPNRNFLALLLDLDLQTKRKHRTSQHSVASEMPRSSSFLGCTEDRYETPPGSELQRLLWIKPGSSSHLDEVRPGIYIGDMYAAKNKRLLQSLKITHVLNAAHGKFNVNTGVSYYRDTNITYHGVEAFDMSSFDLSPFFYSSAKFIKSAMSTPGGKVLVHCAMGLSRSSTLVLAYLMIHEDMTLVEAIKAVAEHRNICPNSGFVEQLRELDQKLLGRSSAE